MNIDHITPYNVVYTEEHEVGLVLSRGSPNDTFERYCNHLGWGPFATCLNNTDIHNVTEILVRTNMHAHGEGRMDTS
jgi:hypothetical protein